MPVITQVCKETKLWINPNLRWPNSSFTCSFKFTYFCIDLKKGILLKKIRNHRHPLNPHQKTNMFRQKCLGYSPKSFNMWGYSAQAKINAFLPILTAIDYCRINAIFEWYLHYPDLGEGCRKHWKKGGNR